MAEENNSGGSAQSGDVTGSAGIPGPRADPGRTPGTAEAGTSDKSPQEPGKTPGQAEGDLETVEENLRDKNA